MHPPFLFVGRGGASPRPVTRPARQTPRRTRPERLDLRPATEPAPPPLRPGAEGTAPVTLARLAREPLPARPGRQAALRVALGHLLIRLGERLARPARPA